MSQKLKQYFSFFGRFCLSFVLAFIIMRMIYLNIENDNHVDESLFDANYAVKLSSPGFIGKLAENGDNARTSSIRSRSNRHINSPIIAGKTKNMTSSPLRNDLRRLNASYKSRKRSGSLSARSAYSDWENALQSSNVEWETFVNMPMQPTRTHQAIPFNFLNDLRICSSSSSQSLSTLSMMNTSSVVRKGCNDIWADNFITSWKNRMVKGLCEDNANSKIRCFDSVTKSRYCIFDNAMMNFRKMRKRKQPDGHIGRSWERGFLAADCGDMAPDDIGYLSLYKPDIEGRESAVCDYVFNETVIMYSHENIRNFGMMITDYLNIWSMLWLSGLGRTSRDVSLLHIDGIKRGRYAADVTNQFFRTYNVSFRRIIRAVDFTEKLGRANNAPKLCFKRLIVQPRPILQFHWDGIDDPSCPTPGMSALFQRWNLQVRNNFGLLNHLPSHNVDTNSVTSAQTTMQVLLITRSLRSSGDGTAASASSASAGTAHHHHLYARLFRNQEDIIAKLQQYLSTLTLTTIKVHFVVQDLTLLAYDDQVRLLSESSVVIGMHGAGIASTVHMPIGSPHCCGVVEILPSLSSSESSSVQMSGRGYAHLARKLGHVYERLDLPTTATTLPSGILNADTTGSSGTNNNSLYGSDVPTDRLLEVVGRVIKRIVDGGEASCLLPEVHKTPYL